MSKGALKIYAPFYVAIIVTAVVTTLLFLRPDEAVGLSLLVNQPANDRNSEPGFKLLDPSTGLPEMVVIKSEVRFDGGAEVIPSAAVDIIRENGSAGFINITALPIPVRPATGEALTVPQGTLLVDVVLEGIKTFPVGAGYAYGYDGLTLTGGLIQITLRYTPPPITGDYKATITIEVSGQTPISDFKRFSVLDSLGGTALPTLYPISDGESLPGDLVILQMDVTAKVKDIANDKTTGKPKVTASGNLIPNPISMIASGDFHEALLKKWGVAATADYLLPLTIPAGTVPGSFNPTVTAQDIAGQEFTTSGTTVPATSPRLEVVSARSSINVYLMPNYSFVTPALECAVPASPLCTGDRDREFDIVELLKQTVPRSRLNPAFLATIPAITGDVPLSEIVDIMFSYDTSLSPAGFTSYLSDPFPGNDTLRTTRAGRGYIVKTKTVGGIEPFNKILDPDNSQFPVEAIPVPIKLTFTGKFLVNPSEVPGGKPVSPRWNLVGPFSEGNTTVGAFLIGVTIPTRKWEQLLAFKNQLDISLDSTGNVKFLAEGIPEIVFKKRLETLRAPAGEPDAGVPALPSGSSIPAGSGLWLFMCETPVADCVGGELLPIGLPSGE